MKNQIVNDIPRPKRVTNPGSVWTRKDSEHIYMLVSVGPEVFAMINLTTGDRYSDIHRPAIEATQGFEPLHAHPVIVLKDEPPEEDY